MKSKCLTSGGRHILTNSCLSSIPLYCMDFYYQQDGIHKKMDSIKAKFLWQGAKDKFRYHMAKLEMVSRPKALLETGPLPSANYFTECQKSSTRQRIALGKGLLCRVPGSRQKRDTRHRLPRVTVFGHVLLYRVLVVTHSAKIFFLENTLPSAPDTALGKEFFFEMSLPSAPRKSGIF